MPAYLIPISGASKPITLQWAVHICGRKTASPHEIVIKEIERSITDNSDYPLGSLTLIDKIDWAEFGFHLPYKHKIKLATNLAHSSSGFYIFQYVGGFDTFVEKHGAMEILVNGRSLKTITNTIYDGLILTEGDEITFTEGNVSNLKFDAESFRFSLKQGE